MSKEQLAQEQQQQHRESRCTWVELAFVDALQASCLELHTQTMHFTQSVWLDFQGLMLAEAVRFALGCCKRMAFDVCSKCKFHHTVWLVAWSCFDASHWAATTVAPLKEGLEA